MYEEFYPHKNNNSTRVFNWQLKYEENKNNIVGVSRVEYCKQHFMSQSVNFLTTNETVIVPPDSVRNLTTLGLMLGTLLGGHILLFLVSRFLKKDHD